MGQNLVCIDGLYVLSAELEESNLDHIGFGDSVQSQRVPFELDRIEFEACSDGCRMTQCPEVQTPVPHRFQSGFPAETKIRWWPCRGEEFADLGIIPNLNEPRGEIEFPDHEPDFRWQISEASEGRAWRTRE